MALPAPISTADRLRAIIARVDSLAVLPHVVFKVLEITATDASPADVERAVIVDPGFSSKVLIMANSATFGLPKKVTSIKDAVMFLGFRTVRNIALTVGVFDLFVGKTDRESLRRRGWWRQSIDTAVCARWLSGHFGDMSADEAYTCGLLHLLGKTLLDRSGFADYEQVLALEQQGVPDVAVERKLYGVDHVMVAVAACQKWGLPNEILSGINYVNAPGDAEPNRRVRACTAIATRIAARAIEGTSPTSSMIPSWACEVLGKKLEAVEAMSPDAVAVIMAARSSN